MALRFQKTICTRFPSESIRITVLSVLATDNFQLLPANAVWRRPMIVILLEDFTVLSESFIFFIQVEITHLSQSEVSSENIRIDMLRQQHSRVRISECLACKVPQRNSRREEQKKSSSF